MDEAKRHPDIFLNHRVIELFNVDKALLDDGDLILEKLKRVCLTLNMKIWKYYSYKFDLGVTAFAVISSSHVSVHTWPEYAYAHLDIITCAPNAEFEYLLPTIEAEFSPKKIKSTLLDY